MMLASVFARFQDIFIDGVASMGNSTGHLCRSSKESDYCPSSLSPSKGSQVQRTIRQGSSCRQDSDASGGRRRRSSSTASLRGGGGGPGNGQSQGQGPRRKISSRFGGGKGVAWGVASGRIHAMSAQLIRLRCADGEIVTTPDTVQKAPRLVDPEFCSQSRKAIVSIILGALRREGSQLIVPDEFEEWFELRKELQRLGLEKMAAMEATPHTITLSCHSALSVGRLNPEVTFRKVLRIVVCGKVAVCRDVFEEQLNEARDGDATNDKYTSRFFLKHSQLERYHNKIMIQPSYIIPNSYFHEHLGLQYLKIPTLLKETNLFKTICQNQLNSSMVEIALLEFTLET